VRGRTYTVQSSTNLYPTAGTSTDYSYSRHLVDNTKRKVISYAIEWGSWTNVTPFHPPYSEMQQIIQENTAGLLAFCLWVRNSLRRCTFIVERSTLGQDEIDALRQAGSPVIQDAFRVIVDGFAAAEIGISGPGSTLNVPSPSAGMTIICTGNISDSGGYGPEVQRFTFKYNIDFGPTNAAFTFPGETKFVTLDTSVDSVAASAQLQLIKQPNPFILHGDPPWLSIDLRVFVARAGQTKFGVQMGADASAAPGFIQQVMTSLTNNNGSVGGETFGSLPTEELFIYPTDDNDEKVFNFALARVRYIGLIGATDVRVFFRFFQAQTTSGAFDYPPGAQYRRAPSNPQGHPIPLAGIQGNEYVTIPLFATPRIDSITQSMDEQPDEPNIQTFTAIGGSEVDRYFGCWLDINQPFKTDDVTPNNVLPFNVPTNNKDGPFTDPSNPPIPIQQAILRNPHQCLIAEIAFDPITIPIGKDPSNWDKLAQRNIAWSDVGSAQALTTFEIRPTPMGLPPHRRPDELMIDWGNLPADSSAQVYLPAVNAADVLRMADQMYTSHRLESVDDHTIKCRTSGITYIPIPTGGNVNFAGLLSVDFPSIVPYDKVINIIVRQVTNASGRRTTSPPPPPVIGASPQIAAAQAQSKIEWRRVMGAFQLTVPVKPKSILLVAEERRLSVLRWIAEAIPYYNRWYPVFSRYLKQIGDRVKAFGGDPDLIFPSPTGEWRRQKPPGKRDGVRIGFTGKITGLIFDHFGDFEGFILDTEEGEQKFFSRETEVEELCERAWRERLRITVWAKAHNPHRPVAIIIREPPAPFRS
jgi:hypothetical protein